MAIDLGPANDRGFMKGQFVDRYGEKCSIQKSSLASEDCIWLGCDHEKQTDDGTPIGARMHLTQKMVADLIPILQRFVETGEI